MEYSESVLVVDDGDGRGKNPIANISNEKGNNNIIGTFVTSVPQIHSIAENKILYLPIYYVDLENYKYVDGDDVATYINDVGDRFINDPQQKVKVSDGGIVDEIKNKNIMIQNDENLNGYGDFPDVAYVELDISDLMAVR